MKTVVELQWKLNSIEYSKGGLIGHSRIHYFKTAIDSFLE